VSVLATFVGGWGHAEPLLATAALAAAAGHEVTFVGQRAVLPRLRRLGFATVEVGPVTLGTSRRPLVAVDRQAEQVVVRDHFVGEFGAYRAAALGELFASRRPHVVVCDEMDVGAVIAAERLGIPCVSVVVLAAGVIAGPAVVGTAWEALRADHGLGPDPEGRAFGGTLRLAPLPRSFRDPAVPWPSTMRAVRPPILEQDVPSDGGASVYVTLGTVFNIESGDLLHRLVEAMARIDAEVLITTGPHVEPGEFTAVASNVRIEQFVPQREVLGRCRAVVTHGGSGTLVAALSLGVPVVVLPMGADQPDNADRCADLGVGVVLDALTAGPPQIAAAVRAVLDDDRWARAAGRLAMEAAAQPRAADVDELRTLLAR
jgi:UDP:flavonoid glycosyltransferase YjiC (YdhE family)